MTIMKGAEPFLLPGGKRGALLIHGFTGSPSEMRLLGEYLNTMGFTVLTPRLCGHGSSLSEMTQTTWRHWYASAENAWYLLSDLCDEITVIGLSMGALLALKLCSEYPAARAASLSAPIYIADKRVRILPLVKVFRKYVPKKKRRIQTAESHLDKEYLVGYDSTPLESLSSLLELIAHVDHLLPQIKTPILLIQSKAEHTVKWESAQYIYDNIGSIDKQLIWLERSGHVVTLGAERQKVFKNIGNFIK